MRSSTSRPGPWLQLRCAARRARGDAARRRLRARSGSGTQRALGARRCRRSSPSRWPRGSRTGASLVPALRGARPVRRSPRLVTAARPARRARLGRARRRTASRPRSASAASRSSSQEPVARLRDADEAADHVAAARHRRGGDVRRRAGRAAARPLRRGDARPRARVRRRERAEPRPRRATSTG